MAMYFLLNIIADWVTAIGTVLIAILGIPIFLKWWKKDRKIDARPNFELYNSLNDFNNKSIMLKNVGSKAFNMILVATGTQLPPTLILDKYEAESEEAVTIFLGNEFHILQNERLQIHIGYQDIDGRQYQQSYFKTANNVHISSPILLIKRLTKR